VAYEIKTRVRFEPAKCVQHFLAFSFYRREDCGAQVTN